ncbi:MAG: hypothetical protein EP317_01365 [Bacillota bacterium]|nr:MAG: hypothetical protein EP317_01365 [Bacillota bacterium]
MNDHPKVDKFKKYQGLLFKITVSIFVISSALLILGYALVKAVTPAPSVIMYLATAVLYYHFAHFVLSISFVAYYVSQIKNKIGHVKILKSVVSIIFTPISFVIVYIAILLLAFSSCAG